MNQEPEIGQATPDPVPGTLSRIKELRERLAQRPDSEHEQALIRVVLVALASAYLFYYIRKDGRIAPSEQLAVYYAYFYLLFSLLLFLYIVFLSNQASAFRRCVGIIGDIGSVAWITFLTGDDASPLFIILLWVTFGNGFRYGRSYLFASALLSLLFYGVVIVKTGFWDSHPTMSTGLMIGLIILPAYVSILLKKLNAAIRKAEEANLAKGQFLANMSHEMRTPLNGIMGMATLMRDTPLTPEQEEQTTTIEESAKTLLSLIDDVLDISKIEAGKYLIETVDFDLYSLVKSTTAIVAPVAQTKGLTLNTRFSSKIPFLLRGDPLQLRKIFLNLLGNAVKFTEEGEVTLRAELLGETTGGVTIRFEVSDTGIGITPEAQAKIFERFTQADGSVSRRFGGTGLGTTIVKQLVELMGGEIGLASEPGKGSIFWFTLTIEKQQGIMPHVESGCSLEESRVLVVSSDRDVSEAVEGYLSSWGVRAVLVERAAQAFALLVSSADREEGFHIALVVQQGLDMDPYEFARGVKADDTIKRVQLILAVEGEAEPDLEATTKHGYSAAVPTPIDKTLLYNALHFVRPNEPEKRGIASLAKRYLRKKEDRRRCSILVAEDNPTNQKVIAKILERAGHEVVLVENGEEALDALEKHSFDIALLDLQMPVMSGIEAAKIYRMTRIRGPRVPIVALSADATPETRKSCEEAGIDGYLTKPVEVRKILEMIDSMVPYEKRTAAHASTDRGRQTADATDTQNRASAVLDPEIIRELQSLGGSSDFVGKIIRVFLESGDQKLREMRRAVSCRDVETFRNLIHTMKGSAGQIGAMALMEVCTRVAQNGPDAFRESGTGTLLAVEREFSRAKEALLQYVRKQRYAVS